MDLARFTLNVPGMHVLYLLQQSLSNIQQVRKIEVERELKDKLTHLWNKACFRLDLICMVIFIIIDILSIAWIVYVPHLT